MTRSVTTNSLRPIWGALTVLTAVLVAGAAGLLAFAGGANLPTAILGAGGAFATAVGVLVSLARYFGPLS